MSSPVSPCAPSVAGWKAFASTAPAALRWTGPPGRDSASHPVVSAEAAPCPDHVGLSLYRLVPPSRSPLQVAILKVESGLDVFSHQVIQ